MRQTNAVKLGDQWAMSERGGKSPFSAPKTGVRFSLRAGLRLRYDRLSGIFEPLRRVRKEVAMWSIRKIVMTGTVVIAAGAAWHGKSVAQESAASGVGVVTVFDHAKLDGSFANAL